MKVYISADIEGVTGVTTWSETEKGDGDFREFAIQMNREVKAACEGALSAGASELLIKDAHDSGRNLDHNEFPKETKLIRNWAGHPFCMVQGLDSTFDAALFIGYHSAGGRDNNPLAHAMNADFVKSIKINGEYASEFLIHGYAASTLGVPVVFLSGDKGITEEVNSVNKNIATVAVKEGVGSSTINIHPEKALELIKKKVEESLRGNLQNCKLQLPDQFEVEIEYRNHDKAYKLSFYPGVIQVAPHILKYKTTDYFEVLRMLLFLT